MGKVWPVELWILSSPILKFFKTFRVISHLISLSYLLWNLCWLNDSYALKIGTLAIYLFIYDLLTLSLLLHSLGLAKQGWGDSRLILIVKTLLSFFALDIAGQGLSMSREWFKKKKGEIITIGKVYPYFVGIVGEQQLDTQGEETTFGPGKYGRGNGLTIFVGQGLQISGYKWVKFGDLMYSVVTIINNIVYYTWKLLREQILNVIITHAKKKKNKSNFGRGWRC